MTSHFIPATSDSSLVKSMKKVLLDDIKHRYTGDILELLTKAHSLILDSRAIGVYLNQIASLLF
jgi:hypothetical protein